MSRAAGGSRRTAYTTASVGATVLAMVALLGVAVVVGGRSDGTPPSTNLATAQVDPASADRGGRSATSAATDDGGDTGKARGGTAAGKSGRPGATAGQPGGGTVGGSTSDAGAATPRAADGSAATGTGTAGSSSGSGSGDPLAASSNGASPAATGDPVTIEIAEPEPGAWRMAVTSRADGSLLDEGGEGWLVVSEPSPDDGTHRVSSERVGFGVIAGEDVKVTPEGLVATRFALEGEPDRPFAAAAGAPIVALPSTWRPGQSWSWVATAADGRTSVDATSRVVGREVRRIGDDDVETVRVDTELVLGGDRNLTVRRSVWFAPRLGVPVRVQEIAEGTWTGGRSGTRNLMAELTSTDPDDREPIVPQPEPGADPET